MKMRSKKMSKWRKKKVKKETMFPKRVFWTGTMHKNLR